MTTTFDDDVDTIHIVIPEAETLTTEERTGLKGFCRVCGEPTGDGRRTTCDEHRTAPKVHVTSDGKRRGRPPANKLDNDLSGALGKLLFILTLIMGWYMLKRRDIPDPGSDIAETLALTDDEAVNIAHPLARTINATPAGVRVGKKIVDNSDLIDATFSLWEWYKRVDLTLKQHGSNLRGTNERTVQTNGSSGSVAVYREESESGDWERFAGVSESAIR